MRVSVKNIGGHIKHFFQIIWTILLCTNFNVHWWLQSYSVNCVNIQRARISIVWPYKLCTIFWKMKTYSVATPKPFDTYYNLYSTFYLNTLKIYHLTLLTHADIVRFWIFIFYKVV